MSTSNLGHPVDGAVHIVPRAVQKFRKLFEELKISLRFPDPQSTVPSPYFFRTANGSEGSLPMQRLVIGLVLSILVLLPGSLVAQDLDVDLSNLDNVTGSDELYGTDASYPSDELYGSDGLYGSEYEPPLPSEAPSFQGIDGMAQGGMGRRRAGGHGGPGKGGKSFRGFFLGGTSYSIATIHLGRGGHGPAMSQGSTGLTSMEGRLMIGATAYRLVNLTVTRQAEEDAPVSDAGGVLESETESDRVLATVSAQILAMDDETGSAVGTLEGQIVRKAGPRLPRRMQLNGSAKGDLQNQLLGQSMEKRRPRPPMAPPVVLEAQLTTSDGSGSILALGNPPQGHPRGMMKNMEGTQR